MEAYSGLVSGTLEAFHDPQTGLTKEVSIVNGGGLLISHVSQSDGGLWRRSDKQGDVWLMDVIWNNKGVI